MPESRQFQKKRCSKPIVIVTDVAVYDDDEIDGNRNKIVLKNRNCTLTVKNKNLVIDMFLLGK